MGRNRKRVAPDFEKAGLLTGPVLPLKIRNNHRKLFMKTSIYCLRDETRFLRYVGKTIKPLQARLKDHLKEARHGSKNHRCDWIRSLLKKGLTPIIDLITEVDGDGCSAEIAYIKFFRKKGINLVNGTNGGDGVIGHHHSVETRRQIAIAGTGRKHSEETKARMRIICTGRKASDKTRKILSESHKGIHPTETTRRKLSLSHKGFPGPWKGKHLSIKTRIKMSLSHKGKSTWNKGIPWTTAQRQAH